MALDKDDLKQINDLIAASNANIAEQVGGLAGTVKTLTDGFGAEIAKAIDDKIKPITARVEEIAKGAPPKKDPPKKDDDDADGVIARVGSIIDEKLKDVIGIVGTIKQEREQQQTRAHTEALVRRTLDAKKLTGLTKNSGVMERLIAAGPKDEAAVLEAVERERAYAKSLGIAPERFGADPASEGAKEGAEAGSLETKKRATAEAIAAAKKRSNEIL